MKKIKKYLSVILIPSVTAAIIPGCSNDGQSNSRYYEKSSTFEGGYSGGPAVTDNLKSLGLTNKDLDISALPAITNELNTGVNVFKVDKQGDLVRYDNEIFKQQNIAAALFSVSLTLIISFSVIQLDIINESGYQVNSFINALGAFICGLVFIVLHTFLIIGKKNNILDETFIDNNSSAGASLLGFISGAMYAVHSFIQELPSGEDFFSGELMVLKSVFLCLIFFFLIKFLVSGLISRVKKINYRELLVEKHITSVGILDGVVNFIILFVWTIVTLN